MCGVGIIRLAVAVTKYVHQRSWVYLRCGRCAERRTLYHNNHARTMYITYTLCALHAYYVHRIGCITREVRRRRIIIIIVRRKF